MAAPRATTGTYDVAPVGDLDRRPTSQDAATALDGFDAVMAMHVHRHEYGGPDHDEDGYEDAAQWNLRSIGEEDTPVRKR